MTHFVTFFYFGERLALCVFMFVCPRVCVCVLQKEDPPPPQACFLRQRDCVHFCFG